MKFPDYKIHQELSFPLRAYAVNRPSTLTRSAQSDRPQKHTTCNYRSANDLRMTVPLVPGTNGTVIFFHGLRKIRPAARCFFCYFNRTLIFLALSGRNYM